MKKRYLAIFFAFSMASACTFNVSTGTNNATAPSSNTTATNTTNSAPTTTTNQPANTAAAPKKVEAAPATKTDAPASSAKSVRVQFAGGETSTSVTKDIPANSSVEFLMNVQKGQKMEFTVGYDFNESDVNVALYEPDTKDVTMASGPKEPQEFEVKMNGDHRLMVSNTSKKKITITLYLDVN